MTEPCTEIERIVKAETLVGEHGKKLDTMDAKLDILIEKAGASSNSKGFVGGIAAAGWLMGALMCDIIKPLAKPLLAAALAVIK